MFGHKRFHFRLKGYLSLYSLFFLLPFWVFSVSASEQGRFSRVDLDDGLSHKTVYAIHQDRMGYMWFATQNGLNRYDGVRFKVYHQQPGNDLSLAEDNINTIVEDETGYLWLGTWGGGLNRFEPRTEVTTSFRNDPNNPNSLSDDYVQCLVAGKNGILWVGTVNGGLNRFDRKTQTVVRYQPDPNNENSLSHFRIWSVYEQEDGLVWVGTEVGLNLLDPRKNRFLPVSAKNVTSELDQIPIRVMLPRGEERLWIGTTKGLLSMDLKTRELLHYPTATGWGAGLDEVVVNALHETPEGDLWIGTLHNGLICLDGHTGEVTDFKYDPRDGLSISGNDIRALYTDRSSNLWAGTRGSGLAKLDLKPAKFKTYAHKPGDPKSLPFGGIRSVVTDNQGIVWVGTLSSGLSRLNRATETYTHYKYEPEDARSLSNDSVSALGFDNEGRLLVGTFDGLNRLEKDGRFSRFMADPIDEHALHSPRISALYTDSSDRIWVGTLHGLSLFDGLQFKPFESGEKPGQLGPGRVYVVYEDLSRSIWVGMGNDGLYRYREDAGDFQAFHGRANAPAALRNTPILTIYDTGPKLWVGTMGGGLVSMSHDGNQYTAYNRKDGLLNNIVYGILPGGPDALWMSTNKGLCRFDIGKEAFRCYSVFDGLQSNQFSVGAFHRNPDGELFFGGIEGLNVFRPDEVQDRYFIPTVVISSFQVDGIERHRDLTHGSQVVIDPPKQMVSFEFAALDYTRPGKNLFEYKLDGVDQDWVKAGTRTSASYHGLQPGNYEFRVKGSNHDGIWNTYGTELQVTVTSSFFRKWFFYIIYAAILLVCGMAVFSFLKYRELSVARLRALERSERMAVEANRTKSAFLAHVSHELRTPLNAIIGFTELIEEDLNDFNPDHFRPNQCREDLGKIKSSAYLQLAQVNNLLELTRLESGKSELYLETFDIRSMVNAVLHHIEPMLQKTGNSLEVRFMPDEIGEMTADFIKVQGILINLLSNANKFTKKGQISLTVMRTHERGDSQLTFQVSDTGCGMTQDHLGTIFDGFTMSQASEDHQMSGLGLYISQHFSEMMGGRIGVESQLSRGSTFSVKLPAQVHRESMTR